MKALQRKALDVQPRTRPPLQRLNGERSTVRLPRVLSSAEVAECACPDDCLVDHDN